MSSRAEYWESVKPSFIFIFFIFYLFLFFLIFSLSFISFITVYFIFSLLIPFFSLSHEAKDIGAGSSLLRAFRPPRHRLSRSLSFAFAVGSLCPTHVSHRQTAVWPPAPWTRAKGNSGAIQQPAQPRLQTRASPECRTMLASGY